MKLKLDITKEQFDKWVAALRSGKYTQGTDYLKTSAVDGSACHCCLGVLCEVLEYPQINGINQTLFQCGDEEFDTELPSFLTSLSGGYTTSIGKLPDMNKWTQKQKEKFADVVKEYPWDSPHITLATLNDSGEFTFERLADIIEEFLEPAL